MDYGAVLLTLCMAAVVFLLYENFLENGLPTTKTTTTTTTSKLDEEKMFHTCPLRHKNPWESVFIKALGKSKDVTEVCEVELLLTNFTSSKVTINKDAQGAKDAVCEARCLYYKSNYRNNEDKWTSIDEKFHCDIVEVQCRKSAEKTHFYKIVHSQIYEHNRDRQKEFGDLYRKTEAPKVEHNKLHPDVYIIIMDAMAMTSSYRQLPKSVLYLMEAFEAVPYKNVAKVADNSKPNSIAFLFGEIPIVVDRTPFGEPNILNYTLNEHETCNRPLDNDSYIQFEYEDAGYKTMWGCDYSLVNFGYTSCEGIKNQLATHYMRPFQVRTVHQKDQLMKDIMFDSKKCRKSYKYLLNYQEQFINSYKDTPKMSVIWSVPLSHDSEKGVVQSDVVLRKFFERNFEKLNNAVIVFMGDHGPRYDSATGTEQGLYDKNNPMMYISLPKQLRGTTMHENLKRNSEVLSSHHDLHATLVDIIRHQPSSNFTDTSYLKINGTYGSSWLREFEKEKLRNCKTLPIPSQYCLCDYGQKEITDKRIKSDVGSFSLKELNKYLVQRKTAQICVDWAMDEVVQVVSLPSLMYEKKYRIQLQTKPKALFLSSVGVKSDGKYEMVQQSWERLDKYGNTSNCLSDDDSDLRGACFCKKP